jgi:CheY-like chemotaxis protein
LPVANGAEALQLLDTVRPDVVVLDLLMPVLHGWAFMERYIEKTDSGGVGESCLTPLVQPSGFTARAFQAL